MRKILTTLFAVLALAFAFGAPAAQAACCPDGPCCPHGPCCGSGK